MHSLKIALLTALLCFSSGAAATPMTEAQLERTINTAAEHFTRSTRAAMPMIYLAPVVRRAKV